MADRLVLEKHFEMSGGYVLQFSDKTFGEFVFEVVGKDIHDAKYTSGGPSKAKKLRSFWKIESDYIVGKLIVGLVDYDKALTSTPDAEYLERSEACRIIGQRLLASDRNLTSLKDQAQILSAEHLKEQIRRIEESLEKDPSLAIGTAKELIETCCKTILKERGTPVSGSPKMSTLTKDTLKVLRLVPEGVPESTRGAKIIKCLLSNLGTIGNELSELRGLYGTGHGKDGRSIGLNSRHAKLAVGAATTLATFLFETHWEVK
jgi:Abortive infection C-terminus